jgi:hypothetical protein
MKYIGHFLYSAITVALLVGSCGKKEKSQNESVNSNQENTTVTNKNNLNSSNNDRSESVKVEIEGVYSGTDNVGMESTIMLRSSGRMIVQPSVGDGTPSQGRWSGTSDNLSLYIETDQPYYDNYGNLRMGGDKLLGNAKITESGLQIIGGNFYSRQ